MGNKLSKIEIEKEQLLCARISAIIKDAQDKIILDIQEEPLFKELVGDVKLRRQSGKQSASFSSKAKRIGILLDFIVAPIKN